MFVLVNNFVILLSVVKLIFLAACGARQILHSTFEILFQFWIVCRHPQYIILLYEKIKWIFLYQIIQSALSRLMSVISKITLNLIDGTFLIYFWP